MRSVRLLAPAALVVATFAGVSAGESGGPALSVYRALAHSEPGDTIIVHGGKFVNLTVYEHGVTLVGRNGATLAGTTTVLGNGVTLMGFRVASNSSVTIEGDDAVFSKNRIGRHTLVEATGSDRTRIEGNAFGPAGLFFRGGRDAVIRGNTGSLVTELIVSESDGALVERNRIGAVRVHGADAVVRGNRALVIGVQSDHALVEDNATSRLLSTYGSEVRVLSNSARGGIEVSGDDAAVRSNSVKKGLFGIVMHGNNADVSGNALHVGMLNAPADQVSYARCPAILVESTQPGGVIADNVITHLTGTGIVVHGDGTTVTGNTVHGVSSLDSVSITGTGNTVADNDVRQSQTDGFAGNGIVVTGDANVVRDNVIVSAAVDAILVSGGAGNTVSGNAVARAAGCGIAVDADAAGTTVAGCTVAECGLGLVNHAADLSLTGTDFSDNRFADVLDLGAFSLFDGNLFETLSHDAFLSPHR